MANEELISQYIDPAAIKANTDFLISEIKRAKAEFQKLSATKVNIQLAKSLPDITGGIAQAEQQAQAIIRSQEKITQVYKEQSEVLKQHGTVINAFDKAQADAAITATAFGNSQNKSTAALKKSSEESKKSSLELNKQTELKKQLDRQSAQELKNIVREENAVKGSLEQRRAALIRLNAVYDNQSPTERASAAGQRLQRVISGLDAQVKSLELTTGRAQRNVGNYPSAFDKIGASASKAFGYVRQLAYVLPGIGIAGIFSALFDVLGRVITATAYLGEKQTLLNGIYTEAAKASASQVSLLTILKEKLNDVNTTQADRAKYVKEYNKLADEGNKIDETQINNQKLINEKIQEQINLIVKRAIAKAAENKLDEQAAKVVEAQLQVSTFEKFKDARKLTQQEIREANREDQAEQVKNAALNRQNNNDALVNRSKYLNSVAAQNSNALEGQKKYNEAKLKLDREQAELDRQAGLLSPLISPESLSEKGSTAVSKTLKKLSDQISTAFEKFKLEQQRYIDLLNDGVEDEKNSFEDRIELLRSYTAERKVLINEQEKNDIAAIQNKLAVDVENLNKEKKKGADIAGINKEIAIITFNANEQIELIEKRSQIDRLKADDEFYKKKRKLSEDFQKEAEKIAKETAKGAAGAAADAENDEAAELEAKKKRILSFLDTIQNYWEKVSGVISGALNIGFTNRKNAVQDAIDGIERQKDAELKANDARVQSEQDKAANIAIINSRADQARELQRNKQRQIDQQQARAEKALAIFNITIDTAKNIVKATTLFGRITAALIGAAQLAIVLATPIPRFFKGKKKGQAYSGPAIVNDHPDGYTTEVIERGDGTIEIPKGRNVLTHIGADDIIHPDKNAWLNAILNAAHRDAISGTGVKEVKSNDAVLVAAMNKQTQKIVNAINNKTELHLGAGDRGMVALWKHGASTVKYIDQNTNW